MGKGRLEAFSDGVIAIIITIMVLELKAPMQADIRSLWAVHATLISYVLSFIYVGIYWNNHHHLWHVAEKVDGRTLWANLHLLFWLSLVPFVTEWMGQTHFERDPVAVYGFVMFMSAVAFTIMIRSMIRCHGKQSHLAKAIGRDTKGSISLLLYIVGILLTCFNRWLGFSTYILVAV